MPISPVIVDMGCEKGTDPLPGRKIEYLVMHYTEWASSRPGTAREVAEFFSMHARWVSADFSVDDSEFVMYNPDFRNRYCHAVGDGLERRSAWGGSHFGVAVNRNCVNIEMCSTNSTGTMQQPNSETYYLTEAVRSNALVLAKWLMVQCDIDIDHVIRHYDANGKPCPGMIGWNDMAGSEEEWLRFKVDLERQELVGFEMTPHVAPRRRDEVDLSDTADPLAQALIDMDGGFVRPTR